MSAKSDFTDAIGDLQTAIESIATAWASVQSTRATYKAKLTAGEQTRLDGNLGFGKLRNLVHECAKVNEVGFLFGLTRRADGQTSKGGFIHETPYEPGDSNPAEPSPERIPLVDATPDGIAD